MITITLRQARENCRMTVKVASEKSGIPAWKIRRWEKDCRGARFDAFLQLLSVYKVSFDHIHIGREYEALECQRSAPALNDELRGKGSDLPFSKAFVEKLVMEGRATALFRLAVEYAKSFDDFDSCWTLEESEGLRRDVIEAVMRQIAEAIRAQQKHCGQPLSVSGVYDQDTRQHSMLVRCDVCGKAATIMEREKESTASAAV